MYLDSHQHFWHYNSAEFPWINEDNSVLMKNYLPSDLDPLLSALNFDGCIAVQARQTEAETDFLLGLAARNPFIKGVVGWVDLRADNVADRLAHFAQNPLLKGVRHILHDEPEVDFMLQAAFKRGIATLAPFGLTYDLLLRPQHLKPAIELVQDFPHQAFVLDHIAKPLIAQQIKEPWAGEIQELATYPNVYCKLSGMVTEADWHNWKPEDFHPYLDIVFEAFGPERLMIGSDWPVCTLAGEYVPVMHIVMKYVKQFSAEVQQLVLGSNCARFYGVN